MIKILISGTGQLNGPVKIDKTIEIDRETLNRFRGQHKDQVITEFLAVHYPGVKINPRQISIRELESVPEARDSKSVKETVKKNLDFENKKNEIELDHLKAQNKIEIERLKKQEKTRKINIAKEEFKNGGNKYLYYLKSFWYWLDKPWKKIVFFIALFIIASLLNDFINKSDDLKEFELNKNEVEVKYNQIIIDIENSSIENSNEKIKELEQLLRESKTSNELLIDESKVFQKEWRKKIDDAKKAIDSLKNL
jgi:hypothetical protein